MYALSQGEAEAATSKVVAGHIFIAYTSTYILIDLGASHSFVSATFVKKLDMVPDLLNEMCIVSLSLGENLTSSLVLKLYLSKLLEENF